MMRPLIAAACLALLTTRALAEGQSAAELKKLDWDQLVNTEITIVQRRPERLSASPSSAQVITADDIHRTGVTSIPEALRLADNMQVAQVNSWNWAITARGFNNTFANKLLVLMDGRTLYTPLFSGVFWESQDYLLEDISHIEIVSGPGGAAWGPNAVNGVVNIITKEARDTQGFLVTGAGGSFLRDMVGVRYGGQVSTNLYYRVYGKYFDRNSSVFANGADAGDEWRMGQGGARMDWYFSERDLLTMEGDGYGSRMETLANDHRSYNGGNLLSRWTHTISEDSDTRLQLYYDRTRLYEGTLKFLQNFETYDADFQYRFMLGERHHFITGLGYRYTRDRIENGSGVAFLPPDLDRQLFSAFVQDEIRLLPNVFLTLGTKLEHNDYTGLELEPSGRIGWNVTTNHLLWAGISRAVRTPSRIDTQYYAPLDPTADPTQPPFLLAGGPDFRSETVLAYEIGHRAQISGRVSTSLSLFYNQYDHLRSVSTNLPVVVENNLEGDSYGFEAAFTWQMFDWWRWRGGYTVLQEDLHVKPGTADFNNGKAEAIDPQQQFSLAAYLDLSHNIKFTSRLRWVDRLQPSAGGVSQGTVPSYFELDARLAWMPVQNLELAVVGQNLLHAHHPEFGGALPTRTEIPRSVYGKVTWRF